MRNPACSVGPFPPARQAEPRPSALSACEREVVLSIADDEQTWSLFSDSRRLTGKLRRVAHLWGLTPVRRGSGYEFALPLAAVRFVGPRQVTAAQRKHLAHLNSVRALRQKADFPSPGPHSNELQGGGGGSRGPPLGLPTPR